MPLSLARIMLAAASALALALSATPAVAQTLTGTVSRNVDGDTIHVRVRGFDTTVRLIGIDTPVFWSALPLGPVAEPNQRG